VLRRPRIAAILAASAGHCQIERSAMRHILLPTTALMAAPGAALAHPGHVADVAGHDHWVAGAAIGVAIALGLWGALRGGRKEDEPAETDAEDQGDEARA